MFTPRRTRRKNRKRNIIWFNPPYNKNVKTNIGKIFLKLVDKHFPKSNKLHKIFNRNTLKVSYSCTENMAQIIKKHNKKITNTTDKSTNPACNGRIKTKCPLNANCLQPSVIYQVTTKSKDNLEKNLHRTNRKTLETMELQAHIVIHQQEIRTQHSPPSKYLWDLKDKNQDTPEISWKIKKSAPAYNSNSK